MSWNLDQVLTQLKAARAELKDVQRQSREKRDEGLRQRLKEEEEKSMDSTDPHAVDKTAKKIEAIIRSERQQASYTRIKQVFKYTAYGGGLQRVEVPKTDQRGQVMTDAEGKPLREILLEVDDIHKALLERNKKHFHQAAATPFGGEVGEGILADLVGYSGLTEAAKAIVDGTFMEQYGDSVDMLPETTHLIMELAMPDEIQQLGKINSVVSTEDFYHGFQHWKESTSTSPSGRHLGHYKAIINDPERKKQARDENYVSKRQLDFLEIYTKLVNIPLKYGFAPERWCTSITVMIEKDPGSPRIERLRVIHLFEADYNFCLKRLWGSRMVHHGEDSGTFGDQQDGSRPGRQAINTVHKKTLTYDLSRIFRTALAMFDNDASGCYDRIVVALATIAALRLGMPRAACRMQVAALALMQYFVKTMHGISEAYYRSSRSYRLFGTGQGSGGSPSIWLSIVVVLLSALTAMAPAAMTFVDPWYDILSERNADSYVDDTSTGVNDAMHEEPLHWTEMLALMQSVAQIWERLLYSSGGALELPKCFWYLMYWEWVNGRPRLVPNVAMPGMIALTQGHIPNYTVIDRLEVWEARRTLGVRVAPDGNFRKEAEFLRNKANNYAARLIASNLTEMDTFIFHRSTYVPSMTYSLPVITLDPLQLNKIQSRSIPAILNKLGVNKHFPRSVAFGPKELCGLALLDLSVEQGIRQIHHFMNHTFAQDTVGSMMTIELRALQLESGSGLHLLEYPAEHIPYLTPCWITSLRTFLARHNIKLEYTEAKTLSLSRERDSYLMDEFRKLGIFSDDQLYDINACRLHLKVTTLSDIVDGSGTRITNEALQGTPLPDRFSSLKWPRQPVATTYQRNLWKRALEAAYTSEGPILRIPLGAWTSAPMMIWRNFYDIRTKCVITSTTTTTPAGDRFTEHVIVSRTRHHCRASAVTSVPVYSNLTSLDWRVLIPATIREQMEGSVMAVYNKLQSSEEELLAKPQSFQEYMATLPLVSQRLLYQVRFVPGGERALRECLQDNRKIRAASDGSFDPDTEMAAQGWHLIGNGNVLVEGAGPVDGIPEFLSSTRAELFGIGAIGEFLHFFCEFHNIESKSRVIKCCDNRAAISRINKTLRKYSRRRRMSDDVDIVSHISDRIKASPLRHRLNWVKAHQDDKRPYQELDIWGRMNCDADKIATRFRARMDKGEITPIREGYFTTSSKVCLSVQGKRVTSNFQHSVRRHIQGRKHRTYLERKHGWDNEVWNSIDWPAMKGSYLTLGPMKRIKTSKRVHGWLNTGRQKSKISPDAVDAHKCPRCQADNESQEHILLCPAGSAHRKRYDLVHSMSQDMLRNRTCTAQQLFVWCIRSWLVSPETPKPDVSLVPEAQRDLVIQALEEQERIGWHLAMRGYLSRHWGLAVMAHPASAQSKDQGKNWARKTILLLWNFADAMWEHRNTILHNHELEASRKIRDADINEEISKLYANIETYDVEDRWYFDMPLALRLKKPLRSRRRWLTNAKLLVAKSHSRINIGQVPITTYFPTVPNERPVVNRSLGPFQVVPEYVQTTLTSIFGWRPQDPTSRPR